MTTDAPRSRFRSILRWIPAGFLLLVLPVAWGLHLSGGLEAVVGWYLLISVGQLLAPLTLLVLFVHLVRTRRFSRPMQLTALLTLVALWPALWGFGLLARPFPYHLETQSPAATVRLPSNELLRVAWGGDSLRTNYHAFTPDQRWAYDLLVEPAGHGSDRLEDYGCYGTTVVAPVSARVHHATDGAPDHSPGKPSADLRNPTGNTVVLELATGTFLVIAHLQPGSVAVGPGDRVREGDPLGACGNSGNTSEPHIHIHHQRQDPTEYPINFAEGLPLYFRDHDGPPMPEGGIEIHEGTVTFLGDRIRHGVGSRRSGAPVFRPAWPGGRSGATPRITPRMRSNHAGLKTGAPHAEDRRSPGRSPGWSGYAGATVKAAMFRARVLNSTPARVTGRLPARYLSA